MSYWIFKCNPEKYRLDDRLADPEPRISWTVTRYRDKIAAGDIAFVWQTGASRGFRAILRLESGPQVMPELQSEQKYNFVADTDERWRVVATLADRHMNLPHTVLRATAGLEELSVFRGFQQGTNFQMSESEAKIVFSLHDKNA